MGGGLNTMTDYKKLIQKIEDFGLAFIRVADDTKWTLKKINRLKRQGYFVREVYTVYTGKEFEIFR